MHLHHSHNLRPLPLPVYPCCWPLPVDAGFGVFLDDVGARGLDGTLVVLFCVTPRLLVDDPALGLFGTGNLEGE